jgi:ribosomal-protein-alanine N-acetyltransferase
MASPVFRFRNRSHVAFRIDGKRTFLRYPVIGDYPEWSRLREASRTFLEPWEPRWAHDDLTRPAFRYRIQRYDADRAAGHALALFICLKPSGRLVGGVTLALSAAARLKPARSATGWLRSTREKG